MPPSKEEITKFEREIDAIAANNQLNVIEAITFYCSNTGMEIESCSKLVGKSLKAKIALEAHRLNLLKRTGRKLPR